MGFHVVARSRRRRGDPERPQEDRYGKRLCIYLTNKLHTVLYVGVTTSLSRRMKEHAAGQSAFTRRYNVHKLIYVEEYRDVRDAIAREKQIKSWSRKRKIGLVDSQNSLWKDLSDGFV